MREREREREKCLEAKKVKETKTSEGFFIYLFFKCYGKGWVKFGYIYIYIGLNGVQWAFS